MQHNNPSLSREAEQDQPAPRRTVSKVGPSFRIAGRADCNRARLTYVVRRGGPTAFTQLPPRTAPPSFITFKRELTERELTFFTDIDHLNHEAIAAVDQRDGSIVGVARYVRDRDRAHVAEVAIEVADSFQRTGIGTALASRTIQRAYANGLALLTATALWENHAARGLLRVHGFRARRSRGREIQHELGLEGLESATAKADARPPHGLPHPSSTA
jgi:RimJ/RimL family protein N-acetyltransferase